MVEVFLSFSGDDNKSKLVTDFFTDLCDEISNITTLGQEDLGYQYLQMRTSMKWRQELGDALGTCKVFIPLYSPRYFSSDFCGKEWWAFSQRLGNYAKSAKMPEPDVIVPVIWESVFDIGTTIPKAASNIWARDPKLGDIYAERGLRQIVQLKEKGKYKSEYEEIIMALGRRIADKIRESPLSPTSISHDLESLASAFQDLSQGVAQESNPLQSGPVYKAPPSGPKHVRFAVASGTEEEIRSLREDTSHYGPRVDDWAPYKPDAPDPVVGYAVDVARELSLVPHPEEDFNGEIHRFLDKAESKNELAVIILDPWTIAMDSRRTELADFDRRLCINVAMVIPQSVGDDETVRCMDVLQRRIFDTLGNHAKVRNSVFKTSLDSVVAFKDAVRDVLIELSRLLVVDASEVREAVGSKFIPRPSIDGPTEE